MPTTAKLFIVGRSQALRLPMEFRLSWREFFELAGHTQIPLDFMADREDLPAQERNLF
ncbi:MAG: AbrB family transcriptional regulator [Betaproteobacteria bacterium]|nr:AbrB family transcriptional regulator [Betaproteobacteria bacterium]